MDTEPALPTDEDCANGSRDWPHAPPHRLQSAGVYFLTARAAENRHLLAADAMKDWFQDKLHELARLNYVHQNAVHHKLVSIASEWKWCSAEAFRQAVSPAWLKTISSFKFDLIAEKDGDTQ